MVGKRKEKTFGPLIVEESKDSEYDPTEKIKYLINLHKLLLTSIGQKNAKVCLNKSPNKCHFSKMYPVDVSNLLNLQLLPSGLPKINHLVSNEPYYSSHFYTEGKFADFVCSIFCFGSPPGGKFTEYAKSPVLKWKTLKSKSSGSLIYNVYKVASS